MTDAMFWTSHITSGNQDQLGLSDDVLQVIITAIAGDVFVAPQNTNNPPALDTMSTSAHWNGTIILEGDTLRLNLRQEDVTLNSGELYFGPVTPSSGPCTVSVTTLRQEV